VHDTGVPTFKVRTNSQRRGSNLEKHVAVLPWCRPLAIAASIVVAGPTIRAAGPAAALGRLAGGRPMAEDAHEGRDGVMAGHDARGRILVACLRWSSAGRRSAAPGSQGAKSELIGHK
jgi:hypothetical protein